MTRNVVQTDPWEYTLVDVANDSTTVYAGPCRLKAIHITTALSAHTCPIKDGSTTVYTLPASATANTRYELDGIKCRSSLIVDPNDSGTGNLLVVWAPL